MASDASVSRLKASPAKAPASTSAASSAAKFWDFDLESEAVFRDGLPPRILPRPDLEVMRAKGMERLRKLFDRLCREHLSLSGAPRAVFDRWIYGQLMVPAGECTTRDPLLKRPELASDTAVLTRELEKELPASTYVPWSIRNNARRVGAQLRAFVDASDRWLKKESEGVVPTRLWDALADARRQSQSSSDASQLIHTLEDVAARVRELVRDRVGGELKAMMHKLVSEAQGLCRSLGTLDDATQKGPAPTPDDTTQEGPAPSAAASVAADGSAPKSGQAASAAAATSDSKHGPAQAPTDRSGQTSSSASGVDVLPVAVEESEREVRLIYDTFVERLRPLHYRKLCELFAKHNPDASDQLRGAVLFCVVRRYSTLFGPDAYESASMHAALPEFGFRLLHQRLGVCHENYASPFNCFFSRFNSAFADTDAWLGSIGSFADCHPVEGSFETGPPYTEEVMDQMAVHVLGLLENSSRPLSFVVFVPDWRKPLLEAQRLMEASKFLRDDMVLKGRQYRYVVGHQHQADERADERYFKLPMSTHLYVLQNDAGADKWPCKGVLEELVDEMERRAEKLIQRQASSGRWHERPSGGKRTATSRGSPHEPRGNGRDHARHDRRDYRRYDGGPPMKRSKYDRRR